MIVVVIVVVASVAVIVRVCSTHASLLQ